MDGAVLALFLISTFIGGLTSGLAGFALGLVVSGVWLHFLTPLQTALLISSYGLLLQTYAIWRLWHAVNWRKIAPLIIGSGLGVVAGIIILPYTAPTALRIFVGALLILYSLYGLTRPAVTIPAHGKAADVAAGFVNGLLGPLTGLAGLAVTVWVQMHDWRKDVQRSTFQPVIFAAMAMTVTSLLYAGAGTIETGKLFLLGVPALVAGMLLGWRLYGHLDEASFRKVMLVLLLFSGLALVVPEALIAIRR
jgi:uncharacterized protein